MGNKITGRKRERVIALYEGRCYLCGIVCTRYRGQNHGHQPPDALTIDHVIALHRGGTCDEENLAVACARCNHSKDSLGFGDPDGLEALRLRMLLGIPFSTPVPYTRVRRSR